jgi:hypothetical protein
MVIFKPLKNDDIETARNKRVSRGGAGGSIIFQRVTERSGRGTRVKEIGFIGLPEYASAEQALNKLVARDAV